MDSTQEFTPEQRQAIARVLGKTPAVAFGGRSPRPATFDELIRIIEAMSDALKRSMAEAEDLRDIKARNDSDLAAVGRVLRRMGIAQ